MPILILVGIAMAFTALCAILDWRTRVIPNWLTVPVFAMGLVFHTVLGRVSGLQFSFLGFATGFTVSLGVT
jgi:Flp pilus assembly protein protease CpaA